MDIDAAATKLQIFLVGEIWPKWLSHVKAEDGKILVHLRRTRAPSRIPSQWAGYPVEVRLPPVA